MFTRIPTVLRSQELIDKSFLKASKITEPYHPKIEDKIRKEIMDRISTIESITCSHLLKLVKRFPTIEKLHPFYEDMIDLMFDVDQYKVSLSKAQWAAERIEVLSTELIGQLKKAKTIEKLNQIMKAYYGRYSSIIKSIDKDLQFLSKCRDWMRIIPDINAEMPTFIIAGMPNVGKSSLLSKLTGNEPKVAIYPFTTQTISIGYMQLNNQKIQIIDTPGILDRPMEERNEMELKSILSLRDIRGVIIFLIDPTGHSSYTMEQQENLFTEVKERFVSPIIRVQTKADMTQERIEKLAISTETLQGFDELKEVMSSMIGMR
ncbi:MAG: 50S ribosome-binding GTPase [Candidatus Thermoplasmatota archaeon]|nr:50S ribosome-binding GTPase [Candidatus Thermoplasmatota archaeon]MCL5955012.1 50S ribosome-binding GTPase [Candidatus Thermoplasmatota archaeon]